MATQEDFTAEEWAKLYRAPLVAGMGVSLADVGGPIEMSKESIAAIKTAVTPTEGQGLVVDLSDGLKVVLDEKQNPLSDLKPETGTDPRQMILDELAEVSRIPVVKADNLIEATQDAGEYVEMSATLKRAAVQLSKIARDLRLMSSGPRCGIGEIKLPPLQPGSSIMPGKVNPVMPEVVGQVC